MTRPTTEVPDETLMALADGELDRAEAAALRARMAEDAALAERFALFAETRAMLAPDTASGDVETDPELARLVDAIRAADASTASPAAEPERRFRILEGGAAPGPVAPTVPTRRPAASFRVAVPALAASLALVVGGVLGYGVGRSGDATTGAGGIVAVANAPAAAEAVARALDGSASGQTVAWSDAGSGLKGAVTIVSSHRMAGDRVCREYEVTLDGRDDRSVALGCRGGAGGWRTELVARAPEAGGYAKASGETIAESALADLGSAGALSEDEEAALIKRGWAGPAK